MNATGTDYRCEECGWYLQVRAPAETTLEADCPCCGKVRTFVREFTAAERHVLVLMMAEWKARRKER